MACESQDPRYRARTQISMNFDLALWNAVKHYADRYQLNPTQFLESAAARVIWEQAELFPIEVCRTHGCVMEGNSSGTVRAVCPVNEGSTAYLYLGGEVAEGSGFIQKPRESDAWMQPEDLDE